MKQHKPCYRTTNWPEYNRSLQNRGNLTVWLSPDTPWLGGRTEANGRPPIYTDAAIQCLSTPEFKEEAVKQVTEWGY